ncbi:MAG TPA: hypothetical protein VFA94_14945 [Acidimicrobiales bacterium]|nr:hypothetical protein [Acidimicrobiales bacterium]
MAAARHAVVTLERVNATAQALDTDRFDKAGKLVTESLLPDDVRDANTASLALQDEQAAAFRRLAGRADRVVAVDPGVRRLRRLTAQALRRQAQLLAVPRGRFGLADEPAADRARNRELRRWHVHPSASTPAVQLHAADATLARFRQVADVTIHARLALDRFSRLDILNADTGNVATLPGALNGAVLRDGWAAISTIEGVAVVGLDGARLKRVVPGSTDPVASSAPDAVWLQGLAGGAQEFNRVGPTGRTFPGPVFADAGTFIVSGIRSRVGSRLEMRDPSGKVLRALGPGNVVAVTTGRLAWSDGSRALHVIDAGGSGFDWTAGPGVVLGAFSPDGKALAVVDAAGRVWRFDGPGPPRPGATIDGYPNGPAAVWLGSSLFVPVAATNGRSTVAVVSLDDGTVHFLRIRGEFAFVGAF